MPKRIQEDHAKFRDVVSGRTRKELRRLISSGGIVRQRPKGGKVTISIPKIDIPHFVHGDIGEGVARGPGKEGDTIGRDPQPGKGKGKGKAGDQEGEGINIQVNMEDVLKFMEDELALPEMKPKPSETFEDIKVKYNDISKVGLNSLRHTRRTMKEALKRSAMAGDLGKLQVVPGADIPMKVITPIKQDFRYRQYQEVKIPSSNAVIFFARDCSGSMTDYRCDIVSDMSWWIDCWIKRFYEKVDRCYFVHDTRAQEVNEEVFYNYRHGGGTQCSCVFEAIAKQLENRYPPDKYNVYVFYFTDGENWSGDNERVVNIIKEKLPNNAVNFIGITQVCSWMYEDSVKEYIDKKLDDGTLTDEHVRTSAIGRKHGDGSGSDSFIYADEMTEDDRNDQIIEAIREILGA